MKVLKRIKNIACSPKTKNQKTPGINNLSPIGFHSVHGNNIKVLNNSIVSRRVESFCDAIVFTNRPIKVNEKVCIKFIVTSSNWSGALRFGFTANDPIVYRNRLPKYACPDLINKPGNWAKALCERYSKPENVLIYYVNEEGKVRYSINGQDKGVYFSGVDVKQPLWALLDIYGNTCSIELIDPLTNIKYNQENFIEQESPQISNVPINRANREPLPQVYKNCNLQPLPFHRTRGYNVRLSADKCVAERSDSHYNQGYVFSQRPLRIGEKLVIQILQTDNIYTGSLAFGLTTCNPAKLNSNDLPEDPHLLLDRPEYWIVIKDVASSLTAGDELAFKITLTGEIQLIKNRQLPITLMHVDQSQNFYAFFDLYGSTIKMRVLGSINDSQPQSILLQSNDNYINCISSANRASSNYIYSQTKLNNLHQVNFSPENSSTKESNYSNFIDVNDNNGSLEVSNECSVCYEQPINSALYMCGHMCMCYECAVKQWQGQGGGQCPICRAIILDVIRTYWC